MNEGIRSQKTGIRSPVGRRCRAAVILLLLAIFAPLREASAVVPPFQTVTLTWDAVSPTNQILGYRVYTIDGVTGVTNFAGLTVTNRFTITNVTATPQRWFVTATNPGNESLPCFMEPFRPAPPAELKPVSTTILVPFPGIMESSFDLALWHERMRFRSADGNNVSNIWITATVTPENPAMFLRAKSLSAPATPPPLPR